jgi:hypothetical protein
MIAELVNLICPSAEWLAPKQMLPVAPRCLRLQIARVTRANAGRYWSAGEQTAPAVWFDYSEYRSGEHPRMRLANFRNALQADVFARFIFG